MNKISKNRKGFSAVEGLLIILILVVIGGVGYMVYHNDHKAKTVSASTTAGKTSTASSTKSTTETTANPYAGWKQYCDGIDKYCFKYPSTWQFSDKSFPGQSYVTLTDPSDSVLAIYNNPYSGDGITGSSFTANLIAPLASDKNISVIGGYWAEQAGSPMYMIVNSSDISPDTVTSGTVQLNSNQFTDTDNTAKNGTMTLMPTTSSNELPASQVNSWLNSKDTQTGVLILKSLSAD
jgi:hypothetical protein